jgi:hypothetical protein
MQPELNPFSPGSGLTPPEIVGRQAEIDAFDLIVARSRGRRHNRGMLLHGLRGVGKTVLLNRFAKQATAANWFVVEFEGRIGEPGGEALRLGRALLRAATLRTRGVEPQGQWREAMGTIASFSNTLGVPTMDFGIDATPGRGDSSRLEVDLEEVVEDLASALRESSSAFGLFIDEMQDLDGELLAALLAAQHRAGQKGLPFYIIGAGLPNLPVLLSEVRSYAERLFDFREIGPLDRMDASAALVNPLSTTGATFAAAALNLLLDAADGYPYFLQTYGQAVWDIADDRLIAVEQAELAITEGNHELDMGFFLTRWGRVTPAQREYLRAMAETGGDISSTAEVAKYLGKTLSSLSVVRQGLIVRTIIYVPERGKVAFSVPGMPAFIRRQFDE